MAKYPIAFPLAFALLLAGCAATEGNGYNGGSGGGNDANRQNGTMLVSVQDVVAGCGIQPPDVNTSACGVHSAIPYAGTVAVAATDVTGIDIASASQPELEAKTSSLGNFTTNSNGEFSITLPAGDYIFSFSAGNQGIMAGPIKLEAGQTARVDANFTKHAPGTRPY